MKPEEVKPNEAGGAEAWAVDDARARLAAIVEGSDEAILSKSLDGTVTSWNSGAEQLFGYRAEEIIGQSIRLIIPPERQEEEESFLERLRAGQRINRYETVRIAKNGRRMDVIVTISPIRGESGRIVGASKIIRDVTERKRAQEALRQSEERLSLVIEAAQLGTWDWDLRTGELTWSPMCLAQFGLPSGTRVTYERFLAADHQEDRDRVERAVREALEQRHIYNIELRAVWPDGSVHWISSRGRAYYDESGRPARMAGASLDITERKQVEQALRLARDELARANADLERKVQERTAKLRASVEELEHFSYSITHDMRAPLRAIQNFAYFLEQECAGCVRRESMEYFERIKAAASRMDNLIQDALDYSKVVREEMRLQPVDLGILLRGLVDSYPNLHPPEARIEIGFEHLQVWGNEAGLTQCFSNLLGNGVKFVRRGAAPRVRVWAEQRPEEVEDNGHQQADPRLAHEDHVEGLKPGPWVRIWVEDNGIGIPRAAQERIFAMFQRLHTDREYPGTGIGLAIVRKVVQRMGGQVGVESEEGVGSRFWVELRGAGVTERGSVGP